MTNTAMKSFILIITLTFLAVAGNAQRSVDALFKKYGNKDGFVTLTFRGPLLKLAGLLNDEDDEYSRIAKKITLIRILAQEDDNIKPVNFHDRITKYLSPGRYEELIKVNKSGQDLRMLVRTKGNKLREFLLIAGGRKNIIVQIRGNMNYDDAKKLSHKVSDDNALNML
jgi:hypothetical protein